VHGVRRVRAEAGARAQGEADEGEAGEQGWCGLRRMHAAGG
jgi:hypothetical protein